MNIQGSFSRNFAPLDQISLVSLDHFTFEVRRCQNIPQFCWLLSCVLFFPCKRTLAGTHFSKVLISLLLFLLIKSSYFSSCAIESPSDQYFPLTTGMHKDDTTGLLPRLSPTGHMIWILFQGWRWGWICARLPSWPRLPGIHQLTFARWLTELGGATGAKTKT